MEKIYMEENNSNNRKKRQRQQRQQNLDFSVVLSFVVAIFAIVSIGAFAIASNQGSNVSYAAPTGDTFTMGFYDASDETHYSDVTGYNSDEQFFKVPLYYESSDPNANVVFCVQYGRNALNNTPYQKNTEKLLDDPGLLYILAHSYANNKEFTHVTGEYKKYAEIFATQAAIWMYLDRNTTDDFNKLPTNSDHDTLSVLSQVNLLQLNGKNSIGSIPIAASGIYNDILALVTAAEANSVRKVSVVKESDDFVKTDDGKYYQTSLMTVTGVPSDDLISYDVSLSMNDAIIVDENGTELGKGSATGLAPAARFYVRIPASSIDEKAAKLTVSVLGHFNAVDGYYYTTTEVDSDTGLPLQSVVVVTPSQEDVPGGIEVDLVGVPDTGMNTAQTIYFIGLIVLLCGVGIVYANAKPVESKQ